MTETDKAGPAMGDHALAYLARGKSVFPVCTPIPGRDHVCLQGHPNQRAGWCENPGKIPLVSWAPYELRLPTEQEVTSWWQQWPEANIGMATGVISGVDVLDGDSLDARSEVMLQGIEPGPMVHTGKPGGCHWYLEHPGPGFRNFVGRRPGLDYRGTGGYVLVPPSLHKTGHKYTWVKGTEALPPSPYPTWLRAFFTKSKAERTSDPGDFLNLVDLLDGLEEGERNDTLYRWAGKYIGEDLPIQYARAMAQMAARLCRPPYEEDVALEQVERAYREYSPNTKLVVPGAVEWVEAQYEWQQLGELLDLVEEEPKELVEGLLFTNLTHWVFANPGAGKTLWLTAMALHVACGKPFHGRAVEQGAVCFIEEDSPLSVLATYADMLCDVYDIEPHDIPLWVNKIQGLRITNEETLTAAIAAIERCPVTPILILLDACERIAPSEHFSSKELDPLIRFITWCRNRGITVVVIDHTNKKGSAVTKDTKIDPIDLLYGGRPKSAVSDVMIYISGEIKREATAEYVKIRGETPPPIKMSFAPDTGFALQAERQKLTVTQDQILNAARRLPKDGWYKASFLISQAKVSPRTGGRAVAGLAQRKWLLKRGDTRNTEYQVNPQMPSVFD